MKSLLTLFYICMGVSLLAQDEEILKSIVPVHSVNLIADNNDLKLIGEAIGNSKIVLLGEQDHGDATSMEMKTGLVKYLHEKKGFSVLLFESDFYSLNKNSGFDFTREQVQAFWSKSTSMTPLWEYLKKKKMAINGFAMGFGSDFSRKSAADDLKKIISSLPFKDSPNYLFALKTFEQLINGSARGVGIESRKLFYSVCDTLMWQGSSLPDEFSKQFLYNVKAKAEHVWLNNYRVKHNTVNLVWLLNNLYKNQKVIIWTANIHAVKNYEALIAQDPQRLANYAKVVDKDSIHTMGHTLTFRYNIPVYSLVCISTSGSYTPQAWVSMSNKPEAIAFGENNIESKVKTTGFLDLKKITNASFSMIPVLHRTTFTANWSDVFDGILFISDQRPVVADESMMQMMKK